MGLPVSFSGSTHATQRPAAPSAGFCSRKGGAEPAEAFSFLSAGYQLQEGGDYAPPPWAARSGEAVVARQPRRPSARGGEWLAQTKQRFEVWIRGFEQWKARALGEFLVSRTADGHLGHSSPERACRSRIRSLKFFKAMLGKRVELELYDNGCVEGTFAGVESKQQMFLIRGLVTPMGTYPLAKIRLGDVIAMRFPTASARAPTGLPSASDGPASPSRIEISAKCGSGGGVDDGEKPQAASGERKDASRLLRYWLQRSRLFSRFDDGIMMDATGWYSVTPEGLARRQAERCRCGVIIDAFAGVGGNTIQFAKTCRHVIAVEKDPVRMLCLRENARVYGVLDKITCILGDFTKLGKRLKADVVFLSPPWGGPQYTSHKVFDIKNMVVPDGEALFRLARSISPSVAYFLPKSTPVEQMVSLLSSGGSDFCEVEGALRKQRLHSITAYYGPLARRESFNDEP